jgi:hypothetical protein
MSGSVEDLFSSLLCKGFAYGLDTNPYWKESLPGRYHYFSGNYHKFPEMEPYKFESIVGTVGLQMAPPQTTKSVSFLEFDVDLQLRLLTICVVTALPFQRGRICKTFGWQCIFYSCCRHSTEATETDVCSSEVRCLCL